MNVQFDAINYIYVKILKFCILLLSLSALELHGEIKL